MPGSAGEHTRSAAGGCEKDRHPAVERSHAVVADLDEEKEKKGSAGRDSPLIPSVAL